MLLLFSLPRSTSSVTSDLKSLSVKSSGSRLTKRQWKYKSGGNDVSMGSSASS